MEKYQIKSNKRIKNIKKNILFFSILSLISLCVVFAFIIFFVTKYVLNFETFGIREIATVLLACLMLYIHVKYAKEFFCNMLFFKEKLDEIKYISSISEIEEKQNQIYELEEKLKESQIHNKQKFEQQIYDIKKQINLIYEIEKAQTALAHSLQSADNRIKEYNQSAKRTGRIAVELMGLDLLIIALFWFHYENFIPLFEKLGAWSLTLFSFTVIVILTIAITLLRHQKKLLDEVRHYSAEKRQIELYSGLLKASQHAAAGLNDPQKSAEYVQETFTAIRNRILSEQPHSNTAASTSEKEDYGLEAIVKIIADLAAKSEAKK